MGNSCSRLAAITCSSGTNPLSSAKGTQRGRFAGTLIRTKRLRFSFFSVTSMARFSPRLLIKGNGCDISTAKGVRIGSTDSRKYADISVRWLFFNALYSRMGIAAFARAGRSFFCTSPDTSTAWVCNSSRHTLSCSSGVRPSREGFILFF